MGVARKWILLAVAVSVCQTVGARKLALHSSDPHSPEHQVVKRESEKILTARDMGEMNKKRDKRGAAVADEKKRWTNNIVPFEIATDFDEAQVKVINDKARIWSNYTCVKFESSSTATNRVRIVVSDRDTCSATVGMRGGVQTMRLHHKCFDVKNNWIVLHEFGHILGLYHEQSRPDRDEYITVKNKNIEDGKEHNFRKYGWDYIANLGIPYDYRSLLHYPEWAFSNRYRAHTIVSKDRNYQDVMGTAKILSFRDIQTVNRMYHCSSHCKISDSDCLGGGFVGKDCACWCPTGSNNKVTAVQYCSAISQNNGCSCPVPPGDWFPWTEWTPCTVTCGGGKRHRSRTCDQNPYGNPTAPCEGGAEQEEDCHTFDCRPPGPCSDEKLGCQRWVPEYCSHPVVKKNCKKSCGLC